VQKILEQEPWRSNNSIAKEAGLSPKTVTKLQPNLENPNSDIPATPPVPKKPEERVEKSGRRARGREPGASKPREQSQPKPLSCVRDEKVNSLAEVIKDNIGSLPEIVQSLSG
jgi:hypothetical protein